MKFDLSCLTLRAIASKDFKKSTFVRVMKWHLVKVLTVASFFLGIRSIRVWSPIEAPP